ncbi:MAG: hypothetical protein DCC57_16380 [Chloroflexi bacterium]|nr:MAG: hypothetical protein DCC57_16380 [Chloroflexota bacterium]
MGSVVVGSVVGGLLQRDDSTIPAAFRLSTSQFLICPRGLPMAGRKKTYQVTVDERQRQELHQVVASRKSAQSLVQRARIVLLCAEQPTWGDQQVATAVNCSAGQVRKWRKRGSSESAKQPSKNNRRSLRQID